MFVLKPLGIVTCTMLALFISQAVACHLARATQSSQKRNDLCLHMNRELHVVSSILLHWICGQKLACEAQSLTFENASQLFQSVCLPERTFLLGYNQGLSCANSLTHCVENVCSLFSLNSAPRAALRSHIPPKKGTKSMHTKLLLVIISVGCSARILIIADHCHDNWSVWQKEEVINWFISFKIPAWLFIRVTFMGQIYQFQFQILFFMQFLIHERYVLR